MRLQKQTLALGAVGLIDLATTLYFIGHHEAAEANPMMAAFLSQGLAAFMMAKVGFVAGPLGVLEWARKSHPLFVTRAVNAGLVAYVLMYSVGVARVNAQPDWNNLEAYADEHEWHALKMRLLSKRHGIPLTIPVKDTRQADSKVPPFVTAD